MFGRILSTFLCQELTHFFPMHPFSTPLKNQKTVRFSDVFRRKRNGALRNKWAHCVRIWTEYGVGRDTKSERYGIPKYKNAVSTWNTCGVFVGFVSGINTFWGSVKSSFISEIYEQLCIVNFSDQEI